MHTVHSLGSLSEGQDDRYVWTVKALRTSIDWD